MITKTSSNLAETVDLHRGSILGCYYYLDGLSNSWHKYYLATIGFFCYYIHLSQLIKIKQTRLRLTMVAIKYLQKVDVENTKDKFYISFHILKYICNFCTFTTPLVCSIILFFFFVVSFFSSPSSCKY